MSKYDLSFSKPLVNAAGSLGFTPDPRGPLDPARLGAFITNPFSLEARTPARGPRYLPFPGGFLLHTGYPNPGLRRVLKSYAPRWGRSPAPVLAALLAEGPEQVSQMTDRLEGSGAAGFELGLPPGITPNNAAALVSAALGELPVVARLPLDQAAGLALAVAQAGAAAVSLGPPRGALIGPDGQLVHGRLFGPALFPQALAAVRLLAQAGLAVIGGCGVYRPADVRAMLAAGAVAVQLDAVLWRGEFRFEN